MTSEEQAGLGEKGCELCEEMWTFGLIPSLSSSQRSVACLSSGDEHGQGGLVLLAESDTFHSPQDTPTFFSVRFFMNFCWIIVALRCCVRFHCTAK